MVRKVFLNKIRLDQLSLIGVLWWVRRLGQCKAFRASVLRLKSHFYVVGSKSKVVSFAAHADNDVGSYESDQFDNNKCQGKFPNTL